MTTKIVTAVKNIDKAVHRRSGGSWYSSAHVVPENPLYPSALARDSTNNGPARYTHAAPYTHGAIVFLVSVAHIIVYNLVHL